MTTCQIYFPRDVELLDAICASIECTPIQGWGENLDLSSAAGDLVCLLQAEGGHDVRLFASRAVGRAHRMMVINSPASINHQSRSSGLLFQIADARLHHPDKSFPFQVMHKRLLELRSDTPPWRNTLRCISSWGKPTS
jgi:hypothetical protein